MTYLYIWHYSNHSHPCKAAHIQYVQAQALCPEDAARRTLQQREVEENTP